MHFPLVRGSPIAFVRVGVNPQYLKAGDRKRSSETSFCGVSNMSTFNTVGLAYIASIAVFALAAVLI